MWYIRAFLLGVFAIMSASTNSTIDGPPTSADVQATATPEVELLLDWLDKRGYRLDLAAYTALPPNILERDLRYFKTAVEIVGGTNITKRDSYQLLNRDRRAPRRPLESHPGATRSGNIYPFDTWVEEAGEEPVPIQLLPNPALVRDHFLKTSDGNAKSVEEIVQAGAPYNRTIIFTPGPASKDPGYPLSLGQPYYFSSLQLGKIVGRDAELAMPLEKLQAGMPDGAAIAVTITAVALADAIYYVQIERDEHSKSLIAYPIAKGNSGFRGMAARERGHAPFANQVASQQDEAILGHSTALAPRPLASAKQWRWFEEAVVAYETHAANVPPVVILAKDETWQPYKEDYVLKFSLDAVTANEPTVRRVGIFMNIEPQDLLQVVATLHGLDIKELDIDAADIAKLTGLK